MPTFPCGVCKYEGYERQVEACHPYDKFNDGDSVATAIVSNNTTDVEEPAGAVKRLGAWFLLKQQFTLTTAPHHPGPHRRTPPCFPSLLLTPTFTHHRTRSYPLRRTLARTNRAARLVVGRLSAIHTRATPARPPSNAANLAQPPRWASATSRRYAPRPRYRSAPSWATRRSMAAPASKQTATRGPLRSQTHSSSRLRTTSCTFWP
jgi:hypothetical protein